MSDHDQIYNLNDLPSEMREAIIDTMRRMGLNVPYASVGQMMDAWVDNYANDTDLAATNAILCSKPCCQSSYRDGLGVTAFKPEYSRERAGQYGGDPTMRGIIVAVFDEHSHSKVEALIDVEDAKQFVNHLMVAIAAAEGP